jgi:hypothetical protein
MAIFYGDGSNSSAGRTVQMIFVETDALNITMNGTNVEMDVISATITPLSASSRILCLLTTGGGWSGDGQGAAAVWLMRNSTKLASGQTGTSKTGLTTMNNSRAYSPGDQQGQANIIYVDTPSTTSAITYTARMGTRTGNSTAFAVNRCWNYSGNTQDFTTTHRTTLQLLEIAA